MEPVQHNLVLRETLAVYSRHLLRNQTKIASGPNQVPIDTKQKHINRDEERWTFENDDDQLDFEQDRSTGR